MSTDKYYVGSTIICNPIVNIAPTNAGEPGSDIDYAILVAEDSVLYSEFKELGEWFDERDLFAHLVHDTNTLDTYPVLNQFYLDMQATVIAELVRIDDNTRVLKDTATLQNDSLFMAILNDTKAMNEAVSSAEPFEMFERSINAIFLKELEFGIDSITQADNELISTLAWECPYVAGNAVYKARMMYAKINPGTYFNDLEICNNVGMYKNGKGLFDDENEQLDSTTNENVLNHILLDEFERIMMYPNPTEDVVNVSYRLNIKDNAVLQLLDIHGRKIREIHLESTQNKATFSIKGLPAGVYTYRYVVNQTAQQYGKLIKQ